MRKTLQKAITQLYENPSYAEAAWANERYFLSLKKDAAQTVFIELFDSYSQETVLNSRQAVLQPMMHIAGTWLQEEKTNKTINELLENLFSTMGELKKSANMSKGLKP